MRKNLALSKKVNEESSHDIKLDLDVRCQKLIGKLLQQSCPGVALFGEEGSTGADNAPYRWVVDPIDGTVNFAHGLPHAAVSIALQERARSKREADYPDGYRTLVGVVLDPFQNELWTAMRGGRALMNGKPVRVSRIRTLREAMVTIGFSKSRASLEQALPYFTWLVRRVRKVRMLGSAALGLTYVATGRLDAYMERQINLWDFAAGGLIVQCAGGRFWTEPGAIPGKYRMIASNGLIHSQLRIPR
ncbi:MAG TPA: inositol monophosphatase [Verrucomicrobia bacterium]|nr:inositol monophosphatase [Verrucomicrobiota bacterium]